MKGFAGIVLAVAAALPLTVAQQACAQENYPDRPIQMVIGWTAGAQADVLLRMLGQGMSKELNNQPIIVVNKPGAAGLLGLIDVKNAKPDGYTLGFSVSSNYLIAPNLNKDAAGMLENSTQIACFFDYQFGLVVRADAPWKTWNEFKEYAKKNPGKVNYATSGVGTTQHIIFERIAEKEGIKWTHVAYKAGNETIQGLVGGHVDAAIQGPADVVALLRDGRLRMLLSLDDRRWDAFPTVPTVLDAGYDFSAYSKACIHGPKGLPEPIRAKLEAAAEKVIKDPNSAFAEKARSLEVAVRFIGGRDYTKAIVDRQDGFRTTIATLGLK
jgi:tripartite-type tricarboxylate transporter receptor subunit TctC